MCDNHFNSDRVGYWGLQKPHLQRTPKLLSPKFRPVADLEGEEG